MRANGIKHETTTTGTGTLTLTSVSGWPSYDDVFGTSGTRFVDYTILDSAGVPIEGGVGNIALSTMVLTRTYPAWTWNGTTYDATDPSALSLASGTKTVICSAWTGLGLAPFIPATVGDNKGHGVLSSHTITSFSLTHQRKVSFPVYIQVLRPISYVTMRINSGYTGGTSSLGVALYEIGSDGFPGVRLANFGNLGSLTGSTVVTSSALGTPIWVPEGHYIVDILPQFSGGSGTPNLAGMLPIAPYPLGFSWAGGGPNFFPTFYKASQTALNDPATAPDTAQVASSIPWISFS